VKKQIEAIAMAFTDKIELNRQINQTLEQIAQTIFKSWFVDFQPVKAKIEAKAAGRDPERAAMCAISGKLEPELDQLPPEQYQQLATTAALFPDELVESELGLIPGGWEVCCVDEEFDLTMGQSPPGNTYNEAQEGLPFYQGRTDFGFRFPTQRVFCTAPTRFADVGDTLVSVRAPVGDINMATERCCIGRGVAAARHKSRSCSYTYYFMWSIAEVFGRFEAEGTVFGSISKKDFHNIQRVMPPARIVNEFERLAAPIDGMIATSEQTSRTLASLSDRLLPKLLSGELFLGGDDSLLMEQVSTV
jgi:type I restriction enzyme S subunit